MAAAMKARRTALVIGLGRTGRSVLRYLEGTGWRAYASDSDPRRAAGGGTAWRGAQDAEKLLDEVELVIVSPGVPLESQLVSAARRRGIDVIGDVELFARAVTAPVVAVTGTNGKSTVSALVAAMAHAAGLRAASGANLGTPALDLLHPDVELYVLELSSFQLEVTYSLAPAAAAVLNLAPDHLDRHGTFAAYSAAKARIYARGGVAVANRDDPLVLAMVRGRPQVVTFGLDAPGARDYGVGTETGRQWLLRGDERLLATDEVRLAGRHNLANVLAAWALAGAVGIADVAAAAAVREFRPLPHRLGLAGEKNGVQYLDDSKATNVSAASAAIEGLTAPLVVIAGGQGKGQDFAAFADLLAAKARAVILIGVDGPVIERALGGRVEVRHAASMNDAVVLAAGLARPGDQVVLAPACASFDMFRDYGDRGDAFVRAVERLDGD